MCCARRLKMLQQPVWDQSWRFHQSLRNTNLVASCACTKVSLDTNDVPRTLSRLPKNTIVRALMRRSELAWTNIRHPGSDNSPDIVLNHCNLTNKRSNYMPFTTWHRQSKGQTNASNIRGVSSQPARRNISHPQSVEGEVSVVSSRMHTQRADITEHARKDTRRCSHCNSDMRTKPGCWLSYWH